MLSDKAKILKNAKNWTCEGPHRMKLWRRWLLRNQIEGREKVFWAYLFRYSCQQFWDLRCERMSLSVLKSFKIGLLGAELRGKNEPKQWCIFVSVNVKKEHLRLCIFHQHCYALPINSCMVECQPLSTRNLSSLFHCFISVHPCLKNCSKEPPTRSPCQGAKEEEEELFYANKTPEIDSDIFLFNKLR